MTMAEFMEIMDITRDVVIKCLWWMIPVIGGIIAMAIYERICDE